MLKASLKYCRLTSVSVVLALAAATAPRAETLADALVGAYVNSGLLDQNRALLRAADEDVARAASALKPILQWSADISKNFGRTRTGGLPLTNRADALSGSISLIGSLLLYDFGATRYRVEAAKETVLATRSTLLDIEQQVLLRAVNAYMLVLQSLEFVDLRENNVRLLTQELRAARDRFEVGEVTRTDVALAEAQLAEARSGLAGAEGDLQRAIEEYRNAVGRTPTNLAPAPPLPTLTSDIEAAKALAVRNHPSLDAAQHQVAAAELLTNASEADMKPQFSGQARYGLTETADSNSYNRVGSVGVSVGQTIYQGGALSSAVRRNMAQRDAQRANLLVTTKNVVQDVGNAYASLQSARAVIQSSERQIRAAEVAFRGVREEATLGARTTLDVLDAEQALLDARSLAVQARATLYVAAYTVLSSTGQLTARDLRLPVQIYDPAAYYNMVKDSPPVLSKQGKKLDRVLRALQKE